MKTALKLIAIFAVVFFGLVWAITSYLGPDDLKGCGASPSANDAGGKCGKADAIVAVSGGDTIARTDEAIKLYKAGWAGTLIFSGAAADKSGPSNAQVMAQRATDAGVDPNAILTENLSETTTQNATETSNIFKEHNIKSAILVTSAYHERRAMLEFDKRALGVVIRGHPVASDKQWNAWWWLTPNGWVLAFPEFIRSLILATGGVVDR